MAQVETYDCIATRVRARRAKQGEIVECSGVGRVLTEAGDWIIEVQDADSQLVMSNRTFEALFKPSEACG